jgi:MFS family permease
VAPLSDAARRRDFCLLLGAVGVSAIGSRVTRTALPMVAILVLGATPLELGWLSVLGVLPGALVAWWAGAWIDRRSRRAVMVATDWARALLVATVPVAAMMDVLALPQLFVVSALVCMASVLFEIADHAFLPVLVPAERLVDANSRRETIDAVAEISGPPLGGLLVQWLSAALALAVDALSFVGSALLIGRIRAQEPRQVAALTADPACIAESTGPTSLLREARDGAALVLRDPLLRALFASTMLLTLFMSFMAPLYTLFALRTLGMDPGMLGLVIGVGGIGALVGAALAPRLIARLGAVATARVSLLAGGVATMLTPLAPADALLGPLFLTGAQLLGDALLTIYLVNEVSLRQQAIPLEALGRAAALWKMAASLLAAIGMLAGALLAEGLGIRAAMWTISIGAMLASAPLLLQRR